MKWLLIVMFALALSLWSLCQFDQLISDIPWVSKEMGAQAMLILFIASALALMTTKNVQPMLIPVLRTIGFAQILVVLTQIIWVAFYQGEVEGNAAILPSVPSYIAACLFAWSAFRLYNSANELFGVSASWLIGAAAGAILIVVTLSASGVTSAEDGSILVWMNGLNSILSSFTALLMIGVGLAIRGGSWSRWISPLAWAFAFYLIGNIVIAITGNYNIYSLANWCWFTSLSITVMAAIVLWNDWKKKEVEAGII